MLPAQSRMQDNRVPKTSRAHLVAQHAPSTSNHSRASVGVVVMVVLVVAVVLVVVVGHGHADVWS